MKINGIKDFYKTIGSNGSGEPVRKPASSHNYEAALVPTKDKIQISPQASFRSRLAASVREQAAKFNEPAGEERIAALRDAYQGDACPVSSDQIAGAILRDVLGA